MTRLPELAFEKCIVCLEQPAATFEHIIPLSIGGNLEARMLCSKCNNVFGSSIISKVNNDPRIRLAIENLKEKIPDIYLEARKRLPYIAKAKDSSVVMISFKNKKARVLPGKGTNSSRIQDDEDARRGLAKNLERRHFSKTRICEELKRFDDLEKDAPQAFPDGNTYIKRSVSGLMPSLDEDLFSDRVPVLIAYEFLALFLQGQIYDNKFNFIRQYLIGGIPSEKIRVNHYTTRKYLPEHAIKLLSEDTCTKPAGDWMTVHFRFILGDGMADQANYVVPANKLGIRGDFNFAGGPRALVSYRSGETYLHGGASLQECIVPVILVKLGEEKPVSMKPSITLTYKSEATKITTRFPVIDVVLENVILSLFMSVSDIEILLEARNRKGELVGEAKAGGPVNPATGTITLKPRERVRVTMKMETEFEGKFRIQAINPTTLAVHSKIELETNYTV